MSLEIDPKQIKSFSPINSLNPENARDLINKISATSVAPGHYVFKKGDADKTHIYLLSGAVELVEDKKVIKVIKAGSPESLEPLAHAFPRRVSARAKTTAVVTKINSDMLDIMLTWDQTGNYTVEGVAEEDEETDWMTRILQTRAFHRIPPANIQAMFMRMESVSYKPGDKVIEQDAEGDYFYIIKEGRCLVTRATPANPNGVKLATLVGRRQFRRRGTDFRQQTQRHRDHVDRGPPDAAQQGRLQFPAERTPAQLGGLRRGQKTGRRRGDLV